MITLSRINNTLLAVKGHTRGDKVDHNSYGQLRNLKNVDLNADAPSNALISWSDVLVLQMEIPFDISIQAAMVAKKHNVTVILDPAPASKIPTSAYQYFDAITPNQTEAEFLTGIVVNNKDSAKQAAKILFTRGIPVVIIKIGEQGVYYLTKDESNFIPPFKVNAVDTTSAGDAFSGALAVCLAEKKSIKESIIFK